MEWFGLKGTLKIISFQLPAMARDTFPQTRLLRAPANPSQPGLTAEVLCSHIFSIHSRNTCRKHTGKSH